MDLEATALSITQELIFGALFGEQPEKERQDFTTAFKTLVSNQVWLALLPEFMASWPTPWALTFHRSLRRIDSFVSAQIMATSRNKPSQNTILGRLMSAKDNEGAHLFSEQEVRDNVVSLMLAGYETTSATMCWVLATLSDFPQHSARLRQESRELAEKGTLAYADLARFRFGRAVINEVLRLYPPGWSMRRIAIAEDVLPSGAAIHRGDFILISPYILHRHPAHWSQPNEFRPERFADDGRIREKGYAFMPFGGGPRRCLGMNFAYMELLTVLLAMSQHGSWQVSGPKTCTHSFTRHDETCHFSFHAMDSFVIEDGSWAPGTGVSGRAVSFERPDKKGIQGLPLCRNSGAIPFKEYVGSHIQWELGSCNEIASAYNICQSLGMFLGMNTQVFGETTCPAAPHLTPAQWRLPMRWVQRLRPKW